MSLNANQAYIHEKKSKKEKGKKTRFAFLGFLRLLWKVNCLFFFYLHDSPTGAGINPQSTAPIIVDSHKPSEHTNALYKLAATLADKKAIQ